MHVLTKIFVVLVALLTVLLVPLVVVYAYNENSFQARYQAAEDKADAADAARSVAEESFGAATARKETQLQELTAGNVELRKQSDRQATELRTLEARIAESESMKTQIVAQINTLALSVDAGIQLTSSLIEEQRGLRKDVLRAEQQRVELDEALRDSIAKLDVAVKARRASEVELERLKEELAGAMGQMSLYVARYGSLGSNEVAVGTLPDKRIDAAVINVRRSKDQVLAEIDAGSRDGVQVGWVLPVSRGGAFLANLRILEVDINRSTGILTLEDVNGRGAVDVGCRVRARGAGVE